MTDRIDWWLHPGPDQPAFAYYRKNPKTGKMMSIPARKTLHFTMSKSLKEVLIDEDK